MADDTISRQAVMTAIGSMPIITDGNGEKLIDKTCLRLKIKAIPPAQPEQPAQDYMRTVMKKVKEKYEAAVNTHYIMNPMAWALYQVWKEYDCNG